MDGFEERRVGCLKLNRIREPIAWAEETRRVAGDAALHDVDGFELPGLADAGVLPEALYPNPAGYARLGQRSTPPLRRLSA